MAISIRLSSPQQRRISDITYQPLKSSLPLIAGRTCNPSKRKRKNDLAGKLVAMVTDLKLPRPDREVLRALCDQANELPANPPIGIDCCPALALIAWKADYSERQVRMSLRNLEAMKVAVIKGVHPVYGTTDYEIHLENAPRKPPYEAPRRGRPGRNLTEKIGALAAPQGAMSAPYPAATAPYPAAISPPWGALAAPQGARIAAGGALAAPYPVLVSIEGNTDTEEEDRPSVRNPPPAGKRAARKPAERTPPSEDMLQRIFAPVMRELRKGNDREIFARFYEPLKLVACTHKSLIVAAPEWTIEKIGPKPLQTYLENIARELHILGNRQIEIVCGESGRDPEQQFWEEAERAAAAALKELEVQA